MSNAPFDPGHAVAWHPLATYQSRGPITGSTLLLYELDMTQYAAARVDYASIDLVYEVTSGVAAASLTLRPYFSETGIPFLSITTRAISALSGEAEPLSHYQDDRETVQLSLPFYVTQATFIELSGEEQTDGGSVMSATVGLSVAYYL